MDEETRVVQLLKYVEDMVDICPPGHISHDIMFCHLCIVCDITQHGKHTYNDLVEFLDTHLPGLWRDNRGPNQEKHSLLRLCEKGTPPCTTPL